MLGTTTRCWRLGRLFFGDFYLHLVCTYGGCLYCVFVNHAMESHISILAVACVGPAIYFLFFFKPSNALVVVVRRVRMNLFVVLFQIGNYLNSATIRHSCKI